MAASGRSVMQGAVFLDRDGVLIENRADLVRCWEDVEILPCAVDGLRRLQDAGWPLVIVSNQPGVGWGRFTLMEAERIHARLVNELAGQRVAIARSYLCPHTPDDGCACRKPQPGMLWKAAVELEIDLGRSWVVGDALTDAQAGISAGCRTLLVRTGRGAEQERACNGMTLSPWVDDLAAAAEWVLGKMRKGDLPVAPTGMAA